MINKNTTDCYFYLPCGLLYYHRDMLCYQYDIKRILVEYM